VSSRDWKPDCDSDCDRPLNLPRSLTAIWTSLPERGLKRPILRLRPSSIERDGALVRPSRLARTMLSIREGISGSRSRCCCANSESSKGRSSLTSSSI